MSPQAQSALNPKLQAWFLEYDETHRHPLNRATHKVAIPLIVFHIVVMTGWLKLATIGDFTLSLGHLLVLGSLLFYAPLSLKYAALMLAFSSSCLWMGDRLDHLLGVQTARVTVIAIAVFGWMVQLAGHAIWEKRSPAFTRNLVQALIGPAYFLALLFGEWQAPAWIEPDAAPAK